MQARFASGDFMLGERPGRGDFGLYGQLTQLVRWDPTAMAVAVAEAPKVVHWVDRMDDLSWLPVTDDAGWDPIDALDPATDDLLAEIGRTYAPFMVAKRVGCHDCTVEGTDRGAGDEIGVDAAVVECFEHADLCGAEAAAAAEYEPDRTGQRPHEIVVRAVGTACGSRVVDVMSLIVLALGCRGDIGVLRRVVGLERDQSVLVHATVAAWLAAVPR